jgi:hypothetical protein
MTNNTPKRFMGEPDAEVVRDGKVVGGMWLNPRLKHDHPERQAERARGELCTCFACDMERNPDPQEVD